MGPLFGNEGLRPGIIKIFLDPFHQKIHESRPNDDLLIDLEEYDHITGTESIRHFCRHALSTVKDWGGNLKIITTILGPPPYMTRQKELSGRDLDPVHRADYARYMVSWVKYLIEQEDFPVKFLSLHSNGEDWSLWNAQGLISSPKHYNLYWPPEQVTDFLKLVRRLLEGNGMQQVGLTPGETRNWIHFQDWGYSDAIMDDPQALDSLGLLTSNGNTPANGDCFDWRSAAVDLIREQRPDVHAWVTSMGPASDNIELVWKIRNYIYGSKVNAIISNIGEDNFFEGKSGTGTGIIGNHNGTYTLQPRYYYLKPVYRAGQPGMAVCQVACNSPCIFLLAFSANTTRNPDSFVIINSDASEWEFPIEIRGSASGSFTLYRTSDSENYTKLGPIKIKEGKILYKTPPRSVSVFFGTV